MSKLTKEAKQAWENQFGDSLWGIDCFGFQVVKSAYGDHNSNYGWNLDHLFPIAGANGFTGRDALENIQVCSIFANENKGNKLKGSFKLDKGILNFQIELNFIFRTKNKKVNGIVRLILPKLKPYKIYIYDSYLIAIDNDVMKYHEINFGNSYQKYDFDIQYQTNKHKIKSIFDLVKTEIDSWDNFDYELLSWN